jgi:hypothetical protein
VSSLVEAAPEKVMDDLFIFDDVLYAIDHEDAITKRADIPEYLSVDGFNYSLGDYFYDKASDSVTVYDEDFKLLTYWEVPGYADESNVEILNNGDIFAQYTYVLAEDSAKYDIIDDDGVKYDLTTVIVDAKTGKEKEVKADFIAVSVMNNADLYDKYADNNIYTDDFENIAYIHRIENQRVDDDSQKNADIVLFGNDGKLGASLRAFEEQSVALPTKIAENRYFVNLKTGDKYVVDSKNKIIASVSNGTLTLKAGFFVGKKAVYNMNLEVVYDLNKNDATIINSVGDTLFINKKLADDGYEIISLRSTGEESVLTVMKDEDTEFFTVDGVGYGIKNTHKNESTTYTYYSADGRELVETEYRLKDSVKAGDNYILYGVNGLITEYYLFTVVEIQENKK